MKNNLSVYHHIIFLYGDKLYKLFLEVFEFPRYLFCNVTQNIWHGKFQSKEQCCDISPNLYKIPLLIPKVLHGTMHCDLFHATNQLKVSSARKKKSLLPSRRANHTLMTTQTLIFQHSHWNIIITLQDFSPLTRLKLGGIAQYCFADI